jgi:ATP-dependent RNA helicase DeaD
LAFHKTPASLARALAERDYTEATPVQAAVLEAEAEGRDLLVSAQTGSGKTVAYGISIAETLLDGAETMGPADAPRALIIAPTRELAMQVQRELSWLYRYMPAHV